MGRQLRYVRRNNRRFDGTFRGQKDAGGRTVELPDHFDVPRPPSSGGREEQVHVFEYRCTACGVSAYSSASYATVGICPSCGSPLADDAFATIPEPAPNAVTGPRTDAVRGSANLPSGHAVADDE